MDDNNFKNFDRNNPDIIENDEMPTGNGKKKKKRSLTRLLKNPIIGGIVFGLIAGCIFVGVSSLSNSSSDNTIEVVQTTSSSGEVTTTYDVSGVVEEVLPAMVCLEVTVIETTTESSIFGSRQYEYEATSSGSGIIISSTDDKLYIITNYHVVEDETSIKVTFVDDSSAEATLTGYDEDNDLAVIEIDMEDLDSETLDEIKIAVFADDDDITLGEPCIAIGNALGSGQSVTVGYVSAVNREVEMTDGTMTLIQTDAAINPGNSGGALLNMDGEVIGINSAKYSDTSVEGMGFAIPVSTISEILPGLLEGDQNDTKTVYLGITGTSVTESYVNSFGWPEGVYVSSVSSDSPAEEAGIEAGDIITVFDGTDITSMSELQELIGDKSVGDVVSITVARHDSNGTFSSIELTATLAEKVEEDE